MSEADARATFPFGKLALWLLGALALYVLSFGPVNAWYVRRPFSWDMYNGLQALYAPVLRLEGNESVAPFVQNYETWWDSHLPEPQHMIPYLFQHPRPLLMSGAGTLYLKGPVPYTGGATLAPASGKAKP